MREKAETLRAPQPNRFRLIYLGHPSEHRCFFQHAPFGRLRSTRSATNLAPFFGPDYLDDGIEEPVADATPYGVPLAATLAGLPRRPTNERATLDVEKGVTVVRGPGSQHVLP